MAFVGQLWLPILLSAVFIFIASSIIHMVLKYHSNEWSPAPNQDALQNAVRGAAPGWYAFPMAQAPKDRMSPEWMKKWAEGPSGMLTVAAPGPINMGKNLGQWFAFCLVVAFFTAYAASHAMVMGAGAPSYLTVFRVVGTIGLMAYGFGITGDTIWYGRPWKSWALSMLDSLIYGCVMAGTFGWLWPRG
jgi:hypothetical protein